MTPLTYGLFLIITLVFILLIMRACYFLFVIKCDPLKSVVPNMVWKVMQMQSRNKAVGKIVEENS